MMGDEFLRAENNDENFSLHNLAIDALASGRLFVMVDALDELEVEDRAESSRRDFG